MDDKEKEKAKQRPISRLEQCLYEEDARERGVVIEYARVNGKLEEIETPIADRRPKGRVRRSDNSSDYG